jgi:hypothetical protein
MHEQGTEGVDGNARLTGVIGVVLLVVLFVEGITVLQVRQMITLHVFLGLLLIPPATLKVASTVYRFVRYYRRSPSYVRRGAPPPLLRWTAPLLIVFTAAVLATGVALLTVGPEQPGLVLKAHQFSFVVWFALMALHVVGHVRDAAVLSWREWWPRADRSRPRGKARRLGLVATSIAAGVGLGAALLPVASPWTNRHDLGRQTRHNAESPVGQAPPDQSIPAPGNLVRQVGVHHPGGRPTARMPESLWP